MIKMGTVMGDRYEILEKIGTGGMSDVYRAKDHKLNRMVAMKILRQEFAENENFVSKFRTEAQAAAGLMHPNIVNVYDVGDENGVYYIVMELVDGITLKKYIEEKNRLTVREAVSITIQVAMGLEAAHRNNVIHRDIKPQNIMISREGKVKVTDFGIAKAATSNTITSNVMGSVHYTSPEQARGGYSDAKSDIYSLGVTLFEMLTGRVPFNGDTTVAIAIKHIQEPIPSVRKYVPDIPLSVEKIVLKCCQKSPDRRYQSASELIRDLKQSLITPDEDFVHLVDPDEENATRIATEKEDRELRRELQRYPDEDEPPVRRVKKKSETSGNGSRKKRRIDDLEEDPVRRRYHDEDDLEEEEGPEIEKVTLILGVIVGILVLVILLFVFGTKAGFFGDKSNGSGQDSSVGTSGIEIPDVSGTSFAEAKSILQGKGFTVVKEDDTESGKSRNTVTGQEPAAGTFAPSGSEVKIRVATGNGAGSSSATVPSGSSASASASASVQKVKVPNVVNMPEDTAVATLIEAGLRVGTITPVSSAEVKADTISRQAPAAGEEADPNSLVNLEISTGPEKVSYYFDGTIAAPTSQEASDYTAGVSVQIIFIASDGTVILNTTATEFPYGPVTAHGLKVPTGAIKMVYTVTTPDTVDANGNVTPGKSEQRTVTRAVSFTKE
ncbi:MAG: Stk1 family PASTA domain-containing Ser/Thr kinase [Lachnospiraceae bacterium]|nr:Stk1 family PASTA domain-containing Ser/Thr kinase [Lachnospiraceae bacterium]